MRFWNSRTTHAAYGTVLPQSPLVRGELSVVHGQNRRTGLLQTDLLFAVDWGRMSTPMFNHPTTPFAELISAQDIAARIQEMGAQITADYRDTGDDLVVVSVLKGSVIFLADLIRQIALPLSLDFIGIASYGDETTSSGVVKITSDLTRSIENKHVVVVEDIIDTGLTAQYLLENLRTRQPASTKLCSLLHKPERTEVEVPIAYVGFKIPNKFVVGYGLDVAQQYRNLPFIGVLEE